MSWMNDLNRERRHERARHHARRASEALIKRDHVLVLVELAKTFYYSPRMARERLIYGWLADKAVRIFERLAWLKK